MHDRALVDRVLALAIRLAGPSRTPPDAGPDTPLREGGFWLDSIDLVELAVACEHEFTVTFEGEVDLTPDTMASVRTLAALIATRRS